MMGMDSEQGMRTELCKNLGQMAVAAVAALARMRAYYQ